MYVTLGVMRCELSQVRIFGSRTNQPSNKQITEQTNQLTNEGSNNSNQSVGQTINQSILIQLNKNLQLLCAETQ